MSSKIKVGDEVRYKRHKDWIGRVIKVKKIRACWWDCDGWLAGDCPWPWKVHNSIIVELENRKPLLSLPELWEVVNNPKENGRN